jgi:GntR family transcriptional regulator, transcriptional repressor for pyruvate dehydrogenase complex
MGDRGKPAAAMPKPRLLPESAAPVGALEAAAPLGAALAVPVPAPVVVPVPPAAQRPRNRALLLVDAFSQRIQDGLLRPGDRLPAEAAIMLEFAVSRTVVREALSMLQASKLVVTRHGIGTFATAPPQATGGFRVTADHVATLHDVISVLELRIALESEAASLAATRRTEHNLVQMRQALDAVAAAMDSGEDAVEHDFRFHLEVSRATQNAHFANLMQALGSTTIIPRARLNSGAPLAGSPDWVYLRRVQAEHEGIFDAILAGDAEAARAHMRMHLVNSRERRRKAAAESGLIRVPT